jgi:hypothetical protein
MISWSLNQTKLSKTHGIACWFSIFAGDIDAVEDRSIAVKTTKTTNEAANHDVSGDLRI